MKSDLVSLKNDEEIVLIPVGMGIDVNAVSDSSLSRARTADINTALKCAQDPSAFAEGLMIRGENYRPFIKKKNPEGVPDTFTALAMNENGTGIRVSDPGDKGYLKLEESPKIGRNGQEFVGLAVIDRYVQPEPRPSLPPGFLKPAALQEMSKPQNVTQPIKLAANQEIVLIPVGMGIDGNPFLASSLDRAKPANLDSALKCAQTPSSCADGFMARGQHYRPFIKTNTPDGEPALFTALSLSADGKSLVIPTKGETGYLKAEEKLAVVNNKETIVLSVTDSNHPANQQNLFKQAQSEFEARPSITLDASKIAQPR